MLKVVTKIRGAVIKMVETEVGEKPIMKIVTRETFEEAFAKGNYKSVTPEAEKVINSVGMFELLELKTEMGSALRVLSARKLDEAAFLATLSKQA